MVLSLRRAEVGRPPVFQRAPREYMPIPSAEIEIPAPPPAPTPPTISWLTVALPLVGTLIGFVAIGFIALTSNASGTTFLVSMFISIPMILATYLTSILSYTSQRKRYREQVRQREEKYELILKARRTELEKLRNEHHTARTRTHPPPDECLERVQRRERTLWERSPQDEDFLHIRLGLGEEPLNVTIKVPSIEVSLQDDPLVEKALRLATEFRTVSDVPIVLPLRQVGSAGFVGSRNNLLDIVRALLVHLTTHHAPDEVKLVVVFPPHEVEEWAWVRWFPHVWDAGRERRFLAWEPKAAHQLLEGIYPVLARRRDQRHLSEQDGRSGDIPYYVFVFVDPDLVKGERLLSLLFSHAQDINAAAIFLAAQIDRLPRGCEAIVQVSGTEGTLSYSRRAERISFTPDRLSVEFAENFARNMAPIRLQSTGRGGEEIPSLVTLLDLFGVERVEEVDAAQRWYQNLPFASLAVPIGKKAGGDRLFLDLGDREEAHGPHGLVAGATGSGKTQFLQALVASLAVHFHPHEVAFVLTDFKGGDFAGPFYGLPHLVGTFTNLEPHLVVRIQTSLRAEMERRQRLFDRAGVHHIDEYLRKRRRNPSMEPLPHLILIVDEFAELKTLYPDFIRELVSVSRLGRNLGMHLILATQRPAGIVDEQIRANAKFRVCLRVERVEDSQEVLKRPEAAKLTRRGEGYLQVGDNQVFERFQAAWAGAPYSPNDRAHREPEILEVALDGTRRSLLPTKAPRSHAATASQLAVLVRHLRETAQKEGISPLPGPWLPPLPDHIALPQVRPKMGWNRRSWRPVRTWLQPVVGLADAPARQWQGPLHIDLGRGGHLLLCGAPATGKTTFLQTLAVSLALSHSPEDMWLYIIDCGVGVLKVLEAFPHVGGVVLRDDQERLRRLLTLLQQEMTSRKERFARAGVATLSAYRKATGEKMPAIVVLIDNYQALRSAFVDIDKDLIPVVREGANLGIHVVMSANSPLAIKTQLANNLPLRVALHLVDKGEYSACLGRFQGPPPPNMPGRGLVAGKEVLEFQTALPAEGPTEAERSTALRTLGEQMNQAWAGPRPRPIPQLPKVIPLDMLVPLADDWPADAPPAGLPVPLGMDVDTLEPFTVDLRAGPHFILTGPIETGKTTLLQTWLLALATLYPPDVVYLYLVDMGTGDLRPLASLPHARFVETEDEFADALAEIRGLLQERGPVGKQTQNAGPPAERPFPTLVMAVADLESLRAGVQAGTLESLTPLLRRRTGSTFHLLLCSVSTDLTSVWDGWVKAVRSWQTGFLLGSTEHDDLQIFNLRLPPDLAGKRWPPGEGLFVRRGKYHRIKMATCCVGQVTLRKWVERITQRQQEG